MKSQDGVKESGKFRAIVSDPPLAKFLFSDTRSAPLWLVVRIWVGLQWVSSGWGKAMLWNFDNGGYIHNGGKNLKSFWDRSLTAPPGTTGATITYDWYYNFLLFLRDGGHYEWFAWVITFGEMAVGLGLIFGCLTGIAAFFGTLMNFSFELAGTTSTNPVMFGAAVFLVMGWKTAGWWGLDRYVLPALGTPWQAGKLFRRTHKTPPSSISQRPVSPGGGIPLS
ncbi:MAG: DoxX family protein [Chloroflexota bacterium]|nr:DoxX family membrane protein [Chloroflexota bacterium]